MTRTEIKEAFITKYNKEIRTISKEKDVDMGVAMDILIAHARNRNKSVNELTNPSYFYNFEGCTKLNYEELDLDIVILEDNFVVPKLA